MRPKRILWSDCLPARNFAILVGIMAALAIAPFVVAGTSETAPPSPESPIYGSDSFVKELGRLAAKLEPAGKNPEALRAVRNSLPAAWRVEAGGRRYEVPADLLDSRLRKAEVQPEVRRQQVQQAREYLQALARETASVAREPETRTDSARSKLEAILARQEFSRARQQTWWDRLRERIYEAIGNALMRILGRVGGQRSLGNILLWLGIGVASVWIAYWIFRRWFRTARMAEMALESAAVPVRSWQEWIFAAREAASRGDYRHAVHCAYWAGIARLQDLGALPADRSKTPREYLRALSQSKLIVPETLATRRQALSQLTTRLERTWYGFQGATDTDFRDSLNQLEALGCPLP